MGNACYLLGINITQKGILHISFHFRLGAGTGIDKIGISPFFIGDRCQDGGALNALNPADTQKAGCHSSPRGSWCHQGSTFPVFHQPGAYRYGSILLLAVSHAGMFSHFDDLGSMMYFN